MGYSAMSSRPQMTPLEEIRHSAAHMLGAAVLRLFPQAQLAFPSKPAAEQPTNQASKQATGKSRT